MSDYIETLWAQFVIETEEHLELIEPVLVEAEFNAPTREDIDQLFRSFHSIKGLSKAMDLLGMEAISHRAEDILGLVRDEVITIDPELADLLLNSIDALKQHLRIAESKREDKTPPNKLITKLEHMFKQANGLMEQNAPMNGIESETLEVKTVNDVATESTTSLHSDPDMLIFFAELLQTNLPKFTHFLVPELDIDSEETKELASEIETLVHASGTMDMTQLAEQFSTILSAISDANTEPVVRRNIVAEALMVLVEMIQIIESDVKQECGTSQLVAELRNYAAEKIDLLFLELVNQLRVIADSSAEKPLSDSPEVIELAIQTAEKAFVLNNHLYLMEGNDSSKRLLLTVSDACNQINQGHAVPESGLINLLLNAVSVAESEYRQVADSGEVDPSAVDWNTLNQKIWEAIKHQRDDDGDDEQQISFNELSKKIEINPIFEDCMSNESIKLLLDGLDNDETVFEAFVNLEESEEFTCRFLQWVEQDIQLVTNSTVFIDDKPWSDCLLLTNQEENLLRESIKTLDPERKFLKLETCAKIATDVVDSGATVNESEKESLNSTKKTSMLRVSGETLDQFMSQIGEMVSIRGMLNHSIHLDGGNEALLALRKMASAKHGGIQGEDFMAQLEVLEQQLARFDQVDQKLHTVLSQLQDSALALRVVPMETVFKRLPRPVRDLAQNLGKQVKLEMTGKDVRIDKAMVDVLSDPLMHMVRNSVDHGIELPDERLAAGKPERAVVELEARQQGNTVKVIISDDGQGINTEAVKAKALAKGLVSSDELKLMSQKEIMQFIFAPGFSTAEQITETSGRGVGMDVARTNVMKMGGNITVESELGKGSCFTLELPLSAAIQDTVLVKTAGQMMAIPERYVAEMIEITRDEIQSVKGCQAIVLRDNFLPVYNLGPLLGYRAESNKEMTMVVMVLSDGKQRIGVVIDRSYQRQELFIKDIHQELTALPGVSGAAILGDGKVVLILEVEDLFLLATKQGKNALLALDVDSKVKQETDEYRQANGANFAEKGRVA